MADSPSQVVSELGSHLFQLSRPNKDILLKSLRQAAGGLSQIEQPAVARAASKEEALKVLEADIGPLKKSIIKHGLLRHNDKEVRLLVAICVTEIFRLMAPEPPFEDKYLRGIFKLILSTLMELSDIKSPYFSKRVKILETLAHCRCCVILLDIDSHDLVHEMFNIFFSVVRDSHQRSLINSILSIMTDIIHEEATPFVDTVLRNLVKEGKGAVAAASNLAVSLIQMNSDKLEPIICGFLNSCFLDRDAISSELKESYHEIIFKISQSVPDMLLAVIPNLIRELQTDQIDVRIKAINLAGRLFALARHGVTELFKDLFVELLRRFSDKSAEIRIKALQCGKDCYMANQYGPEAHGVLAAIEDRLLDFDDRVRVQAVVVACDLIKFNLENIAPELISELSERLRDKKISVRKKALQKLTEVYQDYCNKCSEGYMTEKDHFEQIPCKILLCCCEKECIDFRSQNMEAVLSEHLFPPLLPTEERMLHWVHMSFLFNSLHLKALHSILSQKRRVQAEMQLYLALRRKQKQDTPEELQKKLHSSFTKMSACFLDPLKAEECFQKLNEAKDNGLFDTLSQILEEPSFRIAQTIREKFLKMIGHKHPLFDFLQHLSSKCLCNIFSSDHVYYIIQELCTNSFRNKQAKSSMLKLLLAIVKIFPFYLRGSEEQFLKLMEENEETSDELIEVLAKASPSISVEFSSYYSFLERVCLKGTRVQAKYAVSAIASLFGSSEQFTFPKLCKVLVDYLYRERNLPTILQSLGCVGQYSVSAFEAKYEDIRTYIHEKIFQAELSNDQDGWDETSACSYSCKLKIYGLKTLVKSCLPHRGHQRREKMFDLLNVLERLLRKGDSSDEFTSCESDGAHMRLAAAKSVLQLSRKWDLHLPPQIFHLTISMTKDSQSFVKRSFVDKIQKLLKMYAISSRYACALSFALSDDDKDLQDNSFRYMKEFIKNYGRGARIHQASEQCRSITKYPAYTVVFLIHALAYDPGFPSVDCKDAQIFAHFCRPLFLAVQIFLSPDITDGGMDLINENFCCLFFIFRAIKRAEDAVDVGKTPRLHILADVGISALYALMQNNISLSRAPGPVLLPSSFYKISHSKSSNEANKNSCAELTFDRNFIKEVVRMLESWNSMGLHNCTVAPINVDKLPSLSSGQADVLTGGETTVRMKTVVHETDSRRGRKRPLSPKSRGRCADKCRTFKENEKASSKNSRCIVEKEQISSCSFINPGHSSTSLDCNADRNSGNNAVVTRSQAKSVRTCILKDISNQGEAIAGKRIKLLSPLDGCFHSGKVHEFDSESKAYKIMYDNGDVELVCLESESWETLTEESVPEKRWRNHSRQQNNDAQHLVNEWERRNPRRKTPLPLAAKQTNIVESKKVNSSSSEVVNLDDTIANGRTQRWRRKV